MAEKTPTLPPERPPEVYQPLSKLALAGLVIAGGYALVLSAFTLVAFFKGTPLFLGIETLFIPALAAGLAFVGRQQIRNSEGVLSGQALTTWALWLCALFGMGFTAYYVGTYFAITWQASNFTKEWFEKIRSDKGMEAFLDTQEPGRRKHDRPNDVEYMYANYGGVGGRKGALPYFLESEIVRVLRDAATGGELKSLGVKDWEYSHKGYKVEELFQAVTAEGEYNLLVVIQSSQGPEFEGRKWKVDWNLVRWTDKPLLTPVGKTLEQWRRETREYANNWVLRKNRGELVAAFRETLPQAQRVPTFIGFQHHWLAAALALGPTSAGGGPAAGFVNGVKFANPEVVGNFYLPGFHEFLTGGSIQAGELSASKSIREDLIHEVKNGFSNRSRVYFRSQESTARSVPVNKEQGQYQVIHDLELNVYPNGVETDKAPKYRCEASLVLESDTGPMTEDRKPNWHVAGVKLVRGGVPPPDPNPPGGPKAGPGGGGK